MAGPPVVYLHIGAMKTGTTFLQRLMRHHRVDLDRAGVLFPGRTWREQSYGVREVLGRTLDDPVLVRRCRGAWERLSDEMLAYDGRSAVLSMEFLSQATAEQVERVVTTFGARGAEVQVVLTVRDTMRTLPAQWQTRCRTGGQTSWPDFVRSATTLTSRWPSRGPWQGPWRWHRGSAQGALGFARAHDVGAALERWCQAVPADQVHVITVPAAATDPMVLWRRFAHVLGVAPSVCWRVPDKTNASLGYPSAELMRRIHMELGSVRYSDAGPVLKHYLAHEVLAPRARVEPPIALDRAGLRFAARWNERIVRAIEARPVRVVGDLADLPTRVAPEALAQRARRLRSPTDAELLDAAVTAYVGLRSWIRHRTGAEAGALSADGVELIARWRAQGDPVAAAARELAGLARSAMALRLASRVADAGAR